MPGGAPTKYKPAYAEQAEKLCQRGFTDMELADFFDVNVDTIGSWKHAHEEFCQALKVGKEVADARVERSLYHKAIGYSFDAVKIFQHGGEPVKVPYREHVPPDTTAMIFWLKNRKSEDWRDRKHHELTGKDATPLIPVLNVTIAQEPGANETDEYLSAPDQAIGGV